MALTPGDWSLSVAGDFREVAGASNHLVIELHRFVQDLADDQQASGDDLWDITSPNPSTRFTDQIIQLNNGVNITTTEMERFYGGSIEQNNGDDLFSGLQILGSVNLGVTQIEVVQDNSILTSFWGTQAGGGYNGNATAGILARFMVQSRVSGADIDGKRIRVQAREFLDTYSFFNVTLSTGESVAAIQTLNDPQNDTAEGTVGAYTHVTNIEGYQQIDIGDGNGNQPYYSKWTYGADTSGDQLKAVWEYTKYITRQGTAETIHGINGGLFLGITHSFDYDNESANFTEDEVLAWGTEVAFDTGVGTFTLYEYVTIGSSGAAGQLVYYSGAGATGTMKIALEDTAITLVDGDTITGISSGATADINVTITDNDKNGGTGYLWALDDNGATGTMFIQLRTGLAPVDNLEVIGNTSGQTADVNLAPTVRTVPAHFLGSYVGTLIGAYGIGVDPDDLTASDTVEDLDGDTNIPPNNVTFTVFGLVVGDRVLVTNDATSNIDYTQLTLNTSLLTGTETAIVCTASIPSDTPAAGTIRVQLDTGIYKYQAYTSYTSATFTIASTDYSGANNATQPRNIFVSYLDLAATGTSEAFTTIYNADRTLFIRVRDGGASPIVPFETTATLGSAGGSTTAIRTSDA